MPANHTVAPDLVLSNVDFVASDLHFNHQNIIEYCRAEKFSTNQAGLDDMNWHLLASWNRTVDPTDTVVFLGDFAWFMNQDPVTQRKIDNLWETLNGEKIFVRGDHDYVFPSSADEDIYSVEIQHDGRRYWASHFPGDTPESVPGKGMPEQFQTQYPDAFAECYDGWRIHGHHHNNWPDLYPLVNPERRTINCSVELTDYRPLSMDKVSNLIIQNEGHKSI